MRIIAGQFRSRRLKTLAGVRTRPTSDRLRETLFNLIGAAVVDSVFADCYAGSGAVGLEALSRGARRAYFLESHRAASKVIRENLAALKIEEGYEILALDVCAGLKSLERKGVRLDLVFLDPPYQAAEEYRRALTSLGASSLLAPDALVVAEHSKRHTLADTYGALRRTRTRTQGDATLSFYRPVAGALRLRSGQATGLGA